MAKGFGRILEWFLDRPDPAYYIEWRDAAPFHVLVAKDLTGWVVVEKILEKRMSPSFPGFRSFPPLVVEKILEKRMLSFFLEVCCFTGADEILEPSLFMCLSRFLEVCFLRLTALRVDPDFQRLLKSS